MTACESQYLTAEHGQAWCEGWVAAHKGEPRRPNPYDGRTRAGKAWWEGYDACVADGRRGEAQA